MDNLTSDPLAWQPIATLPKEHNTDFLGWDRYADAMVVCRWWDDDGVCNAWNGDPNPDISHWMPLPEPPK